MNDGICKELAELPADALLDEKALSRALSVTGRTIRNMVARCELPPAVKMGGRNVWFSGKVLDWIKEGYAKQEKDAKTMRARIAGYSLQ